MPEVLEVPAGRAEAVEIPFKIEARGFLWWPGLSGSCTRNHHRLYIGAHPIRTADLGGKTKSFIVLFNDCVPVDVLPRTLVI
jgi:hypothetical protein